MSFFLYYGVFFDQSVRPAPSAEHVQKRKESLCGRCRQNSRKKQKQNGLQNSKGGKQLSKGLATREAVLDLLLRPQGTTGGCSAAAAKAALRGRRGGGGGGLEIE